jgi:hypothetical protein
MAKTHKFSGFQASLSSRSKTHPFNWAVRMRVRVWSTQHDKARQDHKTRQDKTNQDKKRHDTFTAQSKEGDKTRRRRRMYVVTAQKQDKEQKT